MQSLTCSSWLLVLYLVPTRVRWKKKCISPKLWCFHPAIPHHLEQQSFPTQITRRDTEMMRYCDLLTFFSVPQHTPKFKPRGLGSFCDFQEAREVEESPGGYPWTISQPLIEVLTLSPRPTSLFMPMVGLRCLILLAPLLVVDGLATGKLGKELKEKGGIRVLSLGSPHPFLSVGSNYSISGADDR